MRLALHTVVCCCLFTTVLTLRGEERSSSLRNRIRIWLQGHVKRDLSSSGQLADVHAGAQHDKSAKLTSPVSSFGLNIRPKRSVSAKTSGCSLGTCVYHDLLHELYRYNNKPKDAKAPQIKISSIGYGRRRRSLTDAARRTGRQRQSTDAAEQVHRHQRRCAMA